MTRTDHVRRFFSTWNSTKWSVEEVYEDMLKYHDEFSWTRAGVQGIITRMTKNGTLKKAPQEYQYNA